MSQSKPAKLSSCGASSTRTNLLGFVLLTIAVGVVSADVREGPERTIDKPSSRAATAFVPRLGKRYAGSNPYETRIDSLGRLLCANSPDCNQMVLLGALVRGIAVQDGNLNLVPGDLEDALAASGLQAPSSFDSTDEDGLKLLRLLNRDHLLRRDTRGSSDNSDELVSTAAAKYGGTKRVAFTPRIGRR